MGSHNFRKHDEKFTALFNGKVETSLYSPVGLGLQPPNNFHYSHKSDPYNDP